MTSMKLAPLLVALVLLTSSVSALLGHGRETGAGVPVRGDVLINEFLLAPNNEAEPYPWVELYNSAALPMNVEGYYLSFTPGNLQNVRLSGVNLGLDTVIEPFGFLVIPIPVEIVRSLRREARQMYFYDPSREDVLDTVSFDPLLHAGNRSRYRSPDGQLWSSTLSNYATPGSANPKQTGSWSGGFEIHVFNVGQGDSQLIIYPSGYTILIDCFEDNWNSDAGAVAVADRIRSITGGSHVNAGVISHLHLDHLGYAGYGGFWHLIEEEGITFDVIVDRDAGQWVDWSEDDECDPDTEILWHNVGTFSGTAQNWLCYATDPKNEKIYNARQVGRLCSKSQILPPDADSMVQIITVDGIGATLEDGVTPVNGNYSAWVMPPSENDFSVGVLIKFGNITYATMGDLDGDYAESSYGYTYNNIEDAIKHRFGKVDIYHANHHGSSHSSSESFLEALQPQVTLVSCGVDNSYGHPDQLVLDRLLSYGSVYLTSDCDTGRDYHDAVRMNSDIVVTSHNGRTFRVSGASYEEDVSFIGRNSPPGTCP